MAKLFLSVTQAAERMKCSVRHFRRIATDQRIPFMRIQNKDFFKVTDIERAAKERATA
jgi:excisionase family DNA binding protein